MSRVPATKRPAAPKAIWTQKRAQDEIWIEAFFHKMSFKTSQLQEGILKTWPFDAILNYQLHMQNNSVQISEIRLLDPTKIPSKLVQLTQDSLDSSSLAQFSGFNDRLMLSNLLFTGGTNCSWCLLRPSTASTCRLKYLMSITSEGSSGIKDETAAWSKSNACSPMINRISCAPGGRRRIG